jgi:hypothetical protein
MTADGIKDLIERLFLAGRHPDNAVAMEAAAALEALLQDIEDLRHDNASMR